MSNSSQQEAQWISLSDLMTGLMMIFLLIAVAFMMKIEADSEKARKVAVKYDGTRKDLYKDLYIEFKNDLHTWGAELDEDNFTIRFKEPDVLFATGKDELSPKFKQILKEFFPRYIKIITSEKYKSSIKEIRIEGHTSSKWSQLKEGEDAYFKNMELSQARTRSTLFYILSLPPVQHDLNWLKENMTANGLSSSKTISNSDGSENTQLSQRVEFRIRTDAEAKMAAILEATK